MTEKVVIRKVASVEEAQNTINEFTSNFGHELIIRDCTCVPLGDMFLLTILMSIRGKYD